MFRSPRGGSASAHLLKRRNAARGTWRWRGQEPCAAARTARCPIATVTPMLPVSRRHSLWRMSRRPRTRRPSRAPPARRLRRLRFVFLGDARLPLPREWGRPRPSPAYVSPEKKMWKVASASHMIFAACDDRMREFLQKLGTAPNRLDRFRGPATRSGPMTKFSACSAGCTGTRSSMMQKQACVKRGRMKAARMR
jgi:hypothetical protein